MLTILVGLLVASIMILVIISFGFLVSGEFEEFGVSLIFTILCIFCLKFAFDYDNSVLMMRPTKSIEYGLVSEISTKSVTVDGEEFNFLEEFPQDIENIRIGDVVKYTKISSELRKSLVDIEVIEVDK